MSDSFAGDPLLYPATLTLVDDSDPRNALSLRPGFEGLAHRTAHLYAGGADSVALVSRWHGIADFTAIPTDWTIINADGHFSQLVLGFVFIFVKLDVPHGATITDITVWVQGAPGHAALPARLPRWELIRKNASATPTVLHTRIDAPTNVASYELGHGIVADPDHVVDRSLGAYMLRIEGESGANSVLGFEVRSVRVQFTTATTRDQGAA